MKEENEIDGQEEAYGGEIVAKLRQVDVLIAQGRPVADAVRSIGVTEVTYYRWRNEYGGLKGDQVKRLKEPSVGISIEVAKNTRNPDAAQAVGNILRHIVTELVEKGEWNARFV